MKGVEIFVESPPADMFVVEQTVLDTSDPPPLQLAGCSLAYNGHKGSMGA